MVRLVAGSGCSHSDETSGPVGGEASVPGVWSVGRGLTGVRLDLRWPPRCLRVSPCVAIPFRPSWGLCVPCVPVDFFCAGMACRRQRRCPPSWYRAFLDILTESCLVPGWGERSGRGMSFLRGWSVGAHGAWSALVGSDIIPSVSVCVWGCVAGVPTVLLSIIAMQVDMRTEVLFQ